MKDTVLFDLDGTLLDRTGSLRDFALWQVRGMLRDSISDKNQTQFCERFIELDSNGLVWKDRVYTDLVREFSIEGWSVAELLASYELCFCGFCKLLPDALQALEQLHERGYKLGLVSNGKSPFQERNFNALGIAGLFGSVTVSDAVGLRKPDPQIFMLACTALDSTPDNSVFVGDNPVADIQGAVSAGLYTVYVPGHYGPECHAADKVCRNFKELVSIVESL